MSGKFFPDTNFFVCPSTPTAIDADGLKNLAAMLVATSVRKLSGRHQAR
jgi:hypothetical protein